MFGPGGERSGTATNTAVSINKAAYRNGCTAIEATSNAVMNKPRGIRRTATPATSAPKNHNAQSPKIIASNGASPGGNAEAPSKYLRRRGDLEGKRADPQSLVKRNERGDGGQRQTRLRRR